MTQEIVLTSLGELAGVRGLFAEAGPVPGTRALVPVIRGSGPEEIGELAQAARRALDELQVLLAHDGERRLEAEQGLGRLRAVRGEAARLRRVASELSEAAGRAGVLARSAFEPAAGQRAGGRGGDGSAAREPGGGARRRAGTRGRGTRRPRGHRPAAGRKSRRMKRR